MKFPLRGLIAAIAILFVAGCSARPWQATPTESALVASRSAIESAADWYVEACVIRLPATAASPGTCELYRGTIAPAVHAAHNAAVDFAGAKGALGHALAAIDLAVQAVKQARAADGDIKRGAQVYAPIEGALKLVRLRLLEAAGGA